MSRDPRTKARLAILFVAGLFVVSCASFQPVEPRHDNVQQQLQIGDTVRIVTKDGRKRTVKLTDMTLDALYGEGPNTFDDGKVLFEDIDSLEKREQAKLASSPWLIYGAIGAGFLILHNSDRTFDND